MIIGVRIEKIEKSFSHFLVKTPQFLLAIPKCLEVAQNDFSFKNELERGEGNIPPSIY